MLLTSMKCINLTFNSREPKCRNVYTNVPTAPLAIITIVFNEGASLLSLIISLLVRCVIVQNRNRIVNALISADIMSPSLLPEKCHGQLSKEIANQHEHPVDDPLRVCGLKRAIAAVPKLVVGSIVSK